MKHGAVYAFYKSQSPIFYRRLIGVLVSSNTSMNRLLRNAILPLDDILSKLNFDNSFDEVFEETKPLINLR